MSPRISVALPRLGALLAVSLAATVAAALAAQGHDAAPALQTASAPAGPAVLVVPDVRGQAYVFAKGMLEDSGFAWSVAGSVRGYSANPVIGQEPAPGTRVVDTGRPAIVLRLARSSSEAERGTPENEAPYAGTEIRTLGVEAAGAE